MKYIYTLLFVTATLSFVACGNSTENQQQESSPSISVKVNSVAGNDTSPFLTASGKIEATNSASLSTRMMGFVDKVHVNVGDKVSKGQLLISINNADLSAKQAQTNSGINEAQAAFNNAETNYKRFQNLFADNSASQKELDDQRVNYEMSKARLEGAKQMRNEVQSQFAYSNLRAPFNGVITNKFIETGDMTNPGVPLISIEGPESFEVTASIPESDISKITSGTKVDVIVKSLNVVLPAAITEVSSSAKNTGGQYLVKAVLDKSELGILSGMYATVKFPIEKSSTSQTVFVPKDVLITHGQLTGIYTVSQSNTAILRWLRTGRNLGDQVEILSGLSADETYIVSADGKLFNGAQITINQ